MLFLVVCRPKFILTNLESVDRALRKIGTPEINGKEYVAKVIPIDVSEGLWLIDFPNNDFPAVQIIPSLQVQRATRGYEDFVFVTPVTKDSAFSLPPASEAYKFLESYFS